MSTNFQKHKLLIVIGRIEDAIESTDDPDEIEAWSCVVDTMLDELHMEDFFGTEGQCDPRGDFRDDTWSIERMNVQEKF